MAHLSFNSRLILALQLDLGIVLEDSLFPQESGIPQIPSGCPHGPVFEDYGGCSSGSSYLDGLGRAEWSWFWQWYFPLRVIDTEGWPSYLSCPSCRGSEGARSLEHLVVLGAHQEAEA